MDDFDAPYAARPDSVKRLRACKTCKLIKTYDQFLTGYCENCPQKRPDIDNPGRRDEFVQSETTDDFIGMVSMMSPHTSWVAKWLRMQYVDEDDGRVKFVKPGLYAISLPGEEAEAGAMGAGEEEEEDEEDEEEEEEEERAERRTRTEGASAGSRGVDAARAMREDPEAREVAMAQATIEPDMEED